MYKDHNGRDTDKPLLQLLKEAHAYHCARKGYMERVHPHSGWNGEAMYSVGWISCLIWIADVLDGKSLYDPALREKADAEFVELEARK